MEWSERQKTLCFPLRTRVPSVIKNIRHLCEVSSVVEHLLHTQGVAGSKPAPRTMKTGQNRDKPMDSGKVRKKKTGPHRHRLLAGPRQDEDRSRTHRHLKEAKVIAFAPTGAWVESTVRRVVHRSGTGSTETWIAQIKTDPLTGIVHEFSRGIAWLRSWF